MVLASLVALVSLGLQTPRALHYTFRPVVTADRTEFHVSLEFKGKPSEEIRLGLPKDYYSGLPLERYLTLKAEEGCVVKDGGASDEKRVQAAPDGTVHIDYVLSYDPKVFRRVSFGPDIAPNYFHLAGCQWLLRVGEDSEKDHYVISVEGKPEGWRLYSSYSQDASHIEADVAYNDLITVTLGGGPQENFRSFEVNSKPVLIAAQGTFDIPKEKIFAMAETIVRMQRGLFHDDTDPFYVVALTSRMDNICGTQVPHCFIAFAKPDVTNWELSKLLAHEMFHTWLPGKISVTAPKGLDADYRYMWFSEGFTDYLARRMLLDASIISKEKYIDLLNEDIISLEDNPYHAATYEEAEKAMKENTFTQTYRRISYNRGAQIALNWDSKIRSGKPGQTLFDLVRRLYEAARPSGEISEAQFLSEAAAFGVDPLIDIESVTVRGGPISVPDSPLIEGYQLKEVEVRGFDPGLDIDASRMHSDIRGVKEDGPAYRAGLRNGMKLVSTTNSNRFANVWFADKPIAFTVLVGGTQKKFEYMPLGNPRMAKIYRRK